MYLPHPDDWPQIIEAQHNSGLSVSEFCIQQKISARDFYRQQFELQHPSKHRRDIEASAFVRVEKSQQEVTREWRDIPETPWVLLCHGQTQLKLPLTTSPVWLSTLVKELNS